MPEKGTSQSNIHRILRKVNQIVYIIFPNGMSDIMIRAQAILLIFCSQDCFTIQSAKVEKGTLFEQANVDRVLTKVNQVVYSFRHNPHAKYHDPSSRASPNIFFHKVP